MKTIEVITEELTISPPNSELLVTLDGPFKKGTKTKYTGNWNSIKPLMAPINFSAKYNMNGSIEVQVTVEINSLLNITQLEVYGSLNLVDLGNTFLQKLYVTYDVSENKPVNVTPYILEFEIPGLLNGHAISSLDICLWNEDPKTSRGTVTTVKSGVGPYLE